MTVHPIKLMPLYALLLCCLAGIPAGAAMANSGRQDQEGTGKRKSPHEYGPEDIHPEARENEAPRRENTTQKKVEAQQPKVKSMAHSAPGTTSASSPDVTPSPAITPSPVVSSVSTAAAITQPAPQKVKNSETIRRKLLVYSIAFLSLFLILVFFVIKMWRQLRADTQNAKLEVSKERVPAEGRQLRIVGENASDKRVKRSDTNPKKLKTRARKASGARFKKA